MKPKKGNLDKMNLKALEEEKERIEHILHSIRKDLFGLNFDDIILPNEDIYSYFKLLFSYNIPSNYYFILIA